MVKIKSLNIGCKSGSSAVVWLSGGDRIFTPALRTHQENLSAPAPFGYSVITLSYT